VEAQCVYVHPTRGQLLRHIAERVSERPGGVRADEDERAPHVHGHQDETEPVGREAGLAVGARRRAQRAVELVGPRVVRALERLRHGRDPTYAAAVRLLAVAAAALAVASAAAAAPPRAGLFVPGVSLGGLRIGMTPARVRGAWGSGYGVCRGCADLTWYFNYRQIGSA